MNESLWKTDEFKQLIGGVKVSDVEKKFYLNFIETAIKKLKNNELTKVSLQVFAKSYPESLSYVNEYYEALYKARVYKEIGNINVKTTRIEFIKKSIKSRINDIKRATMVIYAPILSKMSPEVIIRKYNFSLHEINIVVDRYKQITSGQNSSELGENRNKYEIAKKIGNDIIKNISKEEIYKKYNINKHTFNYYIDLLKEMDNNLYNLVVEKIEIDKDNEYSKLNMLFKKIAYYLENKIDIGDDKLTFTMLDYYCLTSINQHEFISQIIINKSGNISEESKEERDKYAKSIKSVKKFITTNKNVGPFVTAQQMIDLKISLITRDGTKKEITEEICEKIFEIFDREGIPKNRDLVTIAFYRYAKGYPILPLKTEERIVLTKSIKNL